MPYTLIRNSLPAELHHYLERYGEGRNIEISEPDFERYTAELSPFTKSVLKATCKIPFGQTVTYKQLARLMNRDSAVRAVASALGRNPLPIVVPCHRVVATNGIGGYAFGIDLKKSLLEFERDFIKSRL